MSCFLRIIALKVSSPRIPGEGKWIASQGIKHTHRRKRTAMEYLLASRMSQRYGDGEVEIWALGKESLWL